MSIHHNAQPRRQRGLSLLDLILGIVIIGVALASAISLFTVTARGSADPMVRQQAQLIAEAYLEEILLKKFYDPDTNTVCTGTQEASRNFYDNVCDYAGLNDAGQAKNQFGNLMGPTGYSVSVTVVADNTVSLNGLNNTLPNLIRVMRIDVTVTGPGGASIALSGYRTNYNCNAFPADAACKP